MRSEPDTVYPVPPTAFRVDSFDNGIPVASTVDTSLLKLVIGGESERSSPLRAAPEPSVVPFPNGWILDGGLKRYRGDPPHAGRSAAALKLFLTLTLLAGTSSAARASEPADSVLVSYGQLTAIAGLSRPLIASAKKMLCGQGLVRVSHEGQGGRVRYHLDDLASARARILHAPVTGCGDTPALSCFRKLPCRELSSLHALKLYVLLSGLRDERQQDVLISRAEIETFTNLRECQIVAAVSTLRRHRLMAADAKAVRTRDHRERFAITLHPLR